MHCTRAWDSVGESGWILRLNVAGDVMNFLISLFLRYYLGGVLPGRVIKRERNGDQRRYIELGISMFVYQSYYKSIVCR